MSTLGKRVIFVGPADDANHKPLNVEGVAIAATRPGTMMTQSSSGLAVSTSAATVTQQLLVADKDQQRSKSVDDNWTINDNMVAISPRSGEFFNGLVLSAKALAIGDPMTRNTAGLLIVNTATSSQQTMCFCDEVITATATNELARMRKD